MLRFLLDHNKLKRNVSVFWQLLICMRGKLFILCMPSVCAVFLKMAIQCLVELTPVGRRFKLVEFFQ